MLNVVFSRQLLAGPVTLALTGLTWGLSGTGLLANANSAPLVNAPACQLSQAQAVSPQQLQTNAEAFVDALFAQKYDQAWQYLDPEIQDENPPNILQRKHDAFLKRTGPFRERISTRVSGEVVIVKVKFSNLTDDLILLTEPNGKIIGVDFPADENDISAQPPPK